MTGLIPFPAVSATALPPLAVGAGLSAQQLQQLLGNVSGHSASNPVAPQLLFQQQPGCGAPGYQAAQGLDALLQQLSSGQSGLAGGATSGVPVLAGAVPAAADDVQRPGMARASSRGNRAGSETRPASSYNARHQQAEARRRSRINERLEALRQLVPHTERANTANFLEEVVQYVQRLQGRVAELERQLGLPVSVQTTAKPIAFSDDTPEQTMNTAQRTDRQATQSQLQHAQHGQQALQSALVQQLTGVGTHPTQAQGQALDPSVQAAIALLQQHVAAQQQLLLQQQQQQPGVVAAAASTQFPLTTPPSPAQKQPQPQPSQQPSQQQQSSGSRRVAGTFNTAESGDLQSAGLQALVGADSIGFPASAGDCGSLRSVSVPSKTTAAAPPSGGDAALREDASKPPAQQQASAAPPAQQAQQGVNHAQQAQQAAVPGQQQGAGAGAGAKPSGMSCTGIATDEELDLLHQQLSGPPDAKKRRLTSA